MSLVRLQKYLSDCGVASRRGAVEIIADGKVRVNNAVVYEPGVKITPGVDKVTVRKRSVLPPQRGLMILNKPKGVVSTLKDPQGRRTVADFLGRREKTYFPVGRLDYDSSGLILLTNDGDLAQRLTHPRYEFERVYRVKVSGQVAQKTLRRISRGVSLKDGKIQAKARVVKAGSRSTWLELTLKEGRNRLIRRMMEYLLHPVLKLHRVAHGPFRLGKLKIGEVKRLTDKDYQRAHDRIVGRKTR
ncbi:rRNA pseudouridine synthase [Oligoflexia bacterium]|nr:rRNA pseudouridine synthase [Oligoflexia bacterium]